MSFAARLISCVRDAYWLDEKRARAYSLILLLVSAIGFVAWVVMAPHGIDRSGKPLGPDFMSFYAASKLALAGHAASSRAASWRRCRSSLVSCVPPARARPRSAL